MAALTTALIVSAVASAATGAYAAHKQSDAAKSAAATQVASGDKALALTEKLYNQNQANLSPWMNTGAQANTALAGLMGLGGGGGAAPAQAPTLPSGSLADFYGKSATTPSYSRPMPENATPIGTAKPRLTEMTGATQPALDPTTAAAQRQSSYVKMQAPDGTLQDIPASAVPHFTRLGAVVLN